MGKMIEKCTKTNENDGMKSVGKKRGISKREQHISNDPYNEKSIEKHIDRGMIVENNVADRVLPQK